MTPDEIAKCIPDEVVEKVARALCYNRAAPACDCKARGIPCRAPLENLLWPHNEISSQARAALSVARAAIKEECAKVADAARKTDEQAAKEPCTPEERAAFLRGAFKARNIAAAIRAIK
jgi:hypothetical protein